MCDKPSQLTASLAFWIVPRTTSAFRLSASLLMNWLSTGSWERGRGREDRGEGGGEGIVKGRNMFLVILLETGKYFVLTIIH